MCPACTFSIDASAKCTPCAAGYTSLPGAGVCSIDPAYPIKCAAGKYPVGGQCKECPKGYWSNAGDALCSPCPAGTYSDYTGTYKCKACPLGTASSAWAATACPPCYGNTFADSVGTAFCTECPLTAEVDASHTKCVCKQPYSAWVESSNECNTYQCKAGYFADAAPSCTAADKCSVCPKDTYAEYAHSQAACTPCEKGKTTQGATGCTSHEQCK